jgi:hypothetical protein
VFSGEAEALYLYPVSDTSRQRRSAPDSGTDTYLDTCLGQATAPSPTGTDASATFLSERVPIADSERLLIEAGGGLDWVQNHQFCAVR